MSNITHVTHLFFILMPVIILLVALYFLIDIATTPAIGRRQEQRRAIRCWITGIVGITMAAPFIVVSLIAFT